MIQLFLFFSFKEFLLDSLGLNDCVTVQFVLPSPSLDVIYKRYLVRPVLGWLQSMGDVKIIIHFESIMCIRPLYRLQVKHLNSWSIYHIDNNKKKILSNLLSYSTPNCLTWFNFFLTFKYNKNIWSGTSLYHFKLKCVQCIILWIHNAFWSIVIVTLCTI